MLKSRPVPVASQTDFMDWQKRRLKYVTASEVPSILGLNGTMNTAADVFTAKINGARSAPNVFTDHGNANEPVIFDLCLKQIHGFRGRRSNIMYTNAGVPHLSATPDGVGRINGEKCLIEIKAPTWKMNRHKKNKYKYQVLTQMLVMDYSVAVFVWGMPELEFLDKSEGFIGTPTYKQWCAAAGLPHFDPESGGMVDASEPARARVVYNSIKFDLIRISDFSPEDISWVLERTKKFWDCLQTGVLDPEFLL